MSPHIFFSIKGHLGDLKIGHNSIIGEYSCITIDEDENAEEKIEAKLQIGSNTYIGELNNIRATGGTIKIGNNCCISQHVTMVASNHTFKKGNNINKQPWNTLKHSILIGDDVWIGANAVILPGVTINNGAIVGAGTVVNKDIPENAVVVGNPMRIIKYRE